MSERDISAAQRFGALYLEAIRLNHVVKVYTIGTLPPITCHERDMAVMSTCHCH